MKKLYIFTLSFLCCLTVFAIENPFKNPTVPLNFPIVSVSNPAVTEGLPAVFVISLSGTNTTITTFIITTTIGTAGILDFTTVSTTVSVPIGATSVSVSVPTIDDTISESTETFVLNVVVQSSNTANILATGTGTISDNDPLLPTLEIADKTVTEGSIANFVITLSAPSNVPIVIYLKTFLNFQLGQAGTMDFNSVATNVTIPIGATSIIFPFTTYNDGLYEGNETFKLTGIAYPLNSKLL